MQALVRKFSIPNLDDFGEEYSEFIAIQDYRPPPRFDKLSPAQQEKFLTLNDQFTLSQKREYQDQKHFLDSILPKLSTLNNYDLNVQVEWVYGFNYHHSRDCFTFVEPEDHEIYGQVIFES